MENASAVTTANLW